MRGVSWLVGCFAFSAMAAPNAKIAEAQKHLEELEYDKAVRALAAAEAQPGNDRTQVLEILSLQGIVFGTLSREAKARDAFRKLLVLNPEAKLADDQPPRVRTPFYEAKEWVAQQQPLVLESAGGPAEGGTELMLTVRRDLFRLVKRVRFMLPDGGALEAGVEGATARVLAPGAVSSWKVAVLGARDAVLLEQGPFSLGPSAAKPTLEGQATAEPTPAGSLEPTTSTQAPVSRPLRPVSYALFVAAAVSAAVGLGFGVASQETRNRLSGLMPNEAGLIDALTQREALALAADSRRQATVANALFLTAGALAAGAVVLFLVGAPAPEEVSVTLGPQGLVVTGRLP